MFGFSTKNLIFLLLIVSFTTSCFKGKFEFKMAPKKGVAEVEEKKFKLSFYDPAGKNTYCPNIHAIFAANTPKYATQYCLSDSSDSSQACVWKSLPMDIRFKATSEGQKIVKYLHFRNDEFEIIDQVWESNELEIKSSSIAKTDAERITQLRTDELTENQMDEYLCRLDEWSFNVTKNIAMNPSDSFTKERRLIMNQQLSRMYYDEFPFTAKMSKDEISKAGWRLLTFSQEPIRFDKPKYTKHEFQLRHIYIHPESLYGMDVSFIQFKNRNVSLLNFKGTNLRGEQLNEIDPLSFWFGVSGLDLKKWNPQNVKNVEWVDFSYASNLPWDRINQLTTLAYSNLSGLDLSLWKPTQTITSFNYLKINRSTNIPFSYFTSLNINPTELIGSDLKGWIPNAAYIPGISLSEATNIPWNILNTFSNFQSVDFSKTDLKEWIPLTTANISRINYEGAKHIPWTQINANTHSEGYKSSNFSALDLKDFSPITSMNISGVSFKSCTNIPWDQINANTHSNGFMGVNFEGLDLSNWKPNTTVGVGAYLVNAKNIPWNLLNANTSVLAFTGMDVSGLDLKDWQPSATSQIVAISYSNAKNIPWERINANTHASGIWRSEFEYTDLAQWTPSPTLKINDIVLKNATNIPWDKINANTNSGGLERADFSGLDLKDWKPLPNTNISTLNLKNATNINWTELNKNSHSEKFDEIIFEKVDLSNFNPIPNSNIRFNLYKARNIPWNHISSANTGTSYTFYFERWINQIYFDKELSTGAINYEGFIPKHGLRVFSVSAGSAGKSDFEELTESSNFRGVQWWDGSYPWGF